ncbi:MAG: hypothetical protein WAZ27_00670 [Minisyncoccia bacterium]
MLISVRGAHALEEAGAHRAADLVRRAEILSGRPAEMQLRNIVRTALTELSSVDFLIALGKVDDPYAAYQVFVILKEEARRPVPRLLPVARVLVQDVKYSLRHRVWNQGIYYGFLGLLTMPFWKAEYVRSIGPLRRHEKEWFRNCILTFILKHADIVFLRRTCNNRDLFSKKENDRFLSDNRIVYIA